MNDELMMRTAIQVATELKAAAIVSFTRPVEISSTTPIVWVQELQLDILKDLTMADILEVCEQHMLDAAIQLYLSRRLEDGLVVGVFPYAILIYDMAEGKNFINMKEYEDIVPRDVMYAVLRLAQEIAIEGREGRSIGTAFIIGDRDQIFSRSRQSVLNPFEGHDLSSRDIRNRENWESIKEFAQLDGVFVISRDGYVLAAGRYLDLKTQQAMLPAGLGGRHRAIASITKEIPSVGVTVSESGGVVRVFRDGICTLSMRSDIRVKK
ncbi:MAG: diadenylate cyclase [Methanomicrobiales archaeon]|nr:diadenylate cyclase [Methanomicrobiales archaeon]